MNQESNKVFVLDLRLPDAPPQRIRVQEKMVLGQGDEADIQLKGHGLPKKALTFRPLNGQLSVLFHMGGHQWQNQEMKSGRQILLDKGDKLTLANVEIFVREEELGEDEFANVEQTSISNFQELAQKKQDKKRQEEIKSLNFFQRLKLKWTEKKQTKEVAKSKTIKADKLKKGVAVSGGNQAPNPLYRLVAGLAQFFVAYNAYHLWVASILQEHGLLEKLQQVIKPWHERLEVLLQGKLPESIPVTIFSWPNFWTHHDILMALVLLMAFEVIGSILFGCAPVDFLMGLGTEGGQFAKRIKATLRSIIALPLSLLVLPVLPAMIGKRTLAEKLSGSRLMVKGKLIHQLIAPFLAIVLLAAGILLPTYNDFSIYDRPLLNLDQDISASKGGKKDEQIQKQLLKIDALKLNIAPAIPPDIDIIVLSKESGFDLMVVDMEKVREITLKTMNPIAWQEWAAISRQGDPLTSLFNPALAQTDSADVPEFYIGLAEKLRMALALHPNNAIDYFLHQGPFLMGNMNLRHAFLEVAGSAPLVEHFFHNSQHAFAISPLEVTSEQAAGKIKMQILRVAAQTPSLQIIYDQQDASLANFVLRKLIFAPTTKQQEKLGTHAATSMANLFEGIKTKKKMDKNDLEALMKYYGTKAKEYGKKPELKLLFNSVLKRNLNQLEEFMNKKLPASAPEQKIWSALQKL